MSERPEVPWFWKDWPRFFRRLACQWIAILVMGIPLAVIVIVEDRTPDDFEILLLVVFGLIVMILLERRFVK